jgi:hypothetical protein
MLSATKRQDHRGGDVFFFFFFFFFLLLLLFLEELLSASARIAINWSRSTVASIFRSAAESAV